MLFLIIVIVLVVTAVMYVPQLASARAKILAALAAAGAIVSAWAADGIIWFSDFFGG